MSSPIEVPDFLKVIGQFRKNHLALNYSESQWQEIFLHHQRVEAVFKAMLSQSCTVAPPNDLTVAETGLAARYHDIGKIKIPSAIHEATKDPLLAAYYDLMYIHHPLASLAILGKQFIDQHPLAANLIFFHHPDQPINKAFAGIGPIPPQTPEYIWGLPVLITADGIASGWEPRTSYLWKTPAPAEFTVNFITKKLTDFQLNGIVSIESAVKVGYATLNQLGI